jgi:AcrR family transcriptional regulator
MSSPTGRSASPSPVLAADAAAPSRPALTRERIVAAAVAILDAEGLSALTMRRVARELDAGAMSLYRHVAGREELLDLVLESLATDVPITPRTGAWREDVAALARDVRAALLRRRDLTLLLTARLGQGPAGAATLERALAIFRDGGFGVRDAVRANHALGMYVAGACTWEAVGLGGSADLASRAERASAAGAALATLEPDAFPRLAEAATELFAGTVEERFEYGLAMLLDGFAARLAATSGTTPNAAVDAGVAVGAQAPAAAGPGRAG